MSPSSSLSDVPLPTDTVNAGSVVVVWAPGVGRDLAHALITGSGLACLGLPPDHARVANHCESCGSSVHGRPILLGRSAPPAVHISISYAADVTAVALTDAGPVGVDIERRDASFEGVEQVVGLTGSGHEEHSTAVTWVRTESLLKATGRGLRVDPRQVRLPEAGGPPELVAWARPDAPVGPVWLYDVEVTPEHVAAVTVIGAAERPPLAVRQAAAAGQPPRASGGTAAQGAGPTLLRRGR